MKILSVMKKHYKISGMLISFLAMFALLLQHSGQEYYGDAYGYFWMSSEFLEQGLGNFKLILEAGSVSAELFALRGYAWPFIIAILRLLGFKTNIGWLFWWACFVSFGLAYVIPELFEVIFKKRGGIFSRLAVSFFMIIFFPGVILYPLSDIPGITMVCFGILLIWKSFDYIGGKKYVCIFVAGICLGTAYYIRTGTAITCLIAVIIIAIYEKNKFLKKLILISLLCVGIMLAMIPQIIINKECNQTVTYKVPITFTSGVAGMEYYLGVKWLRYETNVTGAHPDTTLISEDEMAGTLLRQQNLVPEEIGAWQLLQSIIRYPLEFLGIYAAKFANIIDTRYGELYIHNLKRMKYGTLILGIAIWFFGLLGISNTLKIAGKPGKYKSREINNMLFFLRHYFLALAACMMPGFLHLLGTHVEPRYFLPVTVFLWQYIGTLCPLKETFLYMYDRIISVVISFVAILGCCSAIWNFTFEKIPHFSYFYQDEPGIIEQTNFTDGADMSDTIGCVNRYELDEDKKITISGFAFIENIDSKDTEMKIVFVGTDRTYLYDLNVTERWDVLETYGQGYLYSGFIFSAYLWDLEAADYNVYIVLDNANTEKIYNTLYQITLE